MRICLTVLLGALLLLGRNTEAQEARELSVLRIPAWPRAAGLANIGASTQLPEALFYNPALAGIAAGVAGSAHFFGSDSTLTTLVAGLTTGVANVGAGVQILRANRGLDPLLDPLPGFPLRERISLTTVTTLGAAMRFKGIRWGAAAKYVQLLDATNEEEERLAFDVGAHRQIGVFQVGFAAQNLGEDLDVAGQDVELPTRFTLAAEGQGLPVGAFVDFGAAAAIAVDREGEVLPALAGQVLYSPLDGWTFVARAGVRRPAPNSNERPVTGGLAVSLDRLTIDYAIEGVKNGDAVHRIGVRLR